VNIKTWEQRIHADYEKYNGLDSQDKEYMCEEIAELRAELAKYSFAGTASGMPGSDNGFTMVAFDGNTVPPGTTVYIRKD